VQQNAHDHKITGVDMVSMNDKNFIISSSLDCKMRAWELEVSGTLKGVAEQVLPCEINDLGLIGEATIIGALKSGELAVWDIKANSISNIQAH